MVNRFSEPHSDPRWWWEGSHIPSCFHCAHFRGMVSGVPCCAAFPDGISKAMFTKGAIHSGPIPGDNGYQFLKYEPEGS